MSAQDRQVQINRWQERASLEPAPTTRGIVARLSLNCQETLLCLVQYLRTQPSSRNECRALRRCLISLRLWSDGYGAASGVLDATLDRSRGLRLTTLAVLSPMCKLLAHGVKNHATPLTEDKHVEQLYSTATSLHEQTRWLLSDREEELNESDIDSSSSSDDDADRKLQDLVHDIKTYTNCLIDLGTALDCPALEPEHNHEPSMITFEQRSAHDYHTDLIKAKFPNAELPLLQSLGRTSWHRYQRMQQERDNNALTQNVSTSCDQSQAARSEFQDSGIGTSLPRPVSVYAKSLASFTSSVAGSTPSGIPALPAQAKDGQLFECNACGKLIRVANSRAWRTHLYMDLRPYTCVFADCGFTKEPFATRPLWTNHLELEHGFGPDWNAIQCPLCFETTKSGEQDVTAHLVRHLVEIASASLPREVESDAESESDASSEKAGTDSSAIQVRDLDDPETAVSHFSQAACSYEQSLEVQQKPQKTFSNEARDAQRTLPPMARGSEADQALSDPGHASSSTSTPVASSQHLIYDHDDSVATKTMARRRKSDKPGDIMHQCRDCKKEFLRPCDLTKHERTHSRPWKCSEVKCKYFDHGWPTEKERDRHVQDEHSTTPARYRCLYPPCTFEFQMEPDCKQHMEKAHGWEYVRSKSNGRKKSQAIAGSSDLITPSSDDFDLSTLPTAAEGSTVGTEPISYDSGIEPNYNMNVRKYMPALSTDSLSKEPMITIPPALSLAQLSPMAQSDVTLFYPQMLTDESFGDAMDALDMQTFSRPTDNLTLFDTGNSSMNYTAQFFPEFNQLGIPQLDRFDNNSNNSSSLEATLDEMLELNANTRLDCGSQADADKSGGLYVFQPGRDWAADPHADGVTKVLGNRTPGKSSTESPGLNVYDANEQLPEDSKASTEALKSKEERPRLACYICGKMFTKKFHRRNHELGHRGGRPYECPDCGKTFTRRNDCTRHQKVH